MNKNSYQEKSLNHLLFENSGKISGIYNELESLCKKINNYKIDMNDNVINIKTVKDEIYLQSLVLDDIIILIKNIKKEFGI